MEASAASSFGDSMDGPVDLFLKGTTVFSLELQYHLELVDRLKLRDTQLDAFPIFGDMDGGDLQ